MHKKLKTTYPGNGAFNDLMKERTLVV